jgi:hypothetical protein
MQATNPLLRPLTALVGEWATEAVRRRSARTQLGIVRGSTKGFRRDRDSRWGRALGDEFRLLHRSKRHDNREVFMPLEVTEL